MENPENSEKPAEESPLILYLKMSRFWFLAGGFLLYALGIGIARYLGHTIDPTAAILGQIWVSTLQLATHFLN